MPAGSRGSVEVRALAAPTRADIDQLAAIFDRYRTDYGERADPSRVASWLEENVGSGRLEAFVAGDQSRFVGFALTMDVPASLGLGHYWQIRDLFVVPDHRRLGVGRALLDFVRAAAIRAGAVRLALQTEADNIPALRLYAELGYEVVEGYRSLMLPLAEQSPGRTTLSRSESGGRTHGS